jgi:hypothetical protein
MTIRRRPRQITFARKYLPAHPAKFDRLSGNISGDVQ